MITNIVIFDNHERLNSWIRKSLKKAGWGREVEQSYSNMDDLSSKQKLWNRIVNDIFEFQKDCQG